MSEKPEVVAKRKATLSVIFDAAKEKHEKRSRELSSQAHKAELILIAWGFLFAGIAGFYQAGLLNVENTQQVIVLLTPILVSIGICVVHVIGRQRENDVPSLPELWNAYTDAYKDDYAGYDDITAKEQLIQAYIEAENINRTKLSKKAYWLTLASWAVMIEILLIVIFVILPNLLVTIKL